jgi:branched-chain amino acid transport system ATP-binding protein
VALLEARDVVTGYGDAEIIHDVSIDVDQEEIVCIIGPNGAGKSTLLKALFGLIDCWDGSVVFDREEITKLRPDEITRKGMVFIPQTENIFPTLSVRENLRMGAYILGDAPEQKYQEVFDRFPILGERQKQQGRKLSGGQQQMLALGRGLMVDPDLILIDEPSAGLAPELVDDVFEKIAEINRAGTAILMVEQNARKALKSADRGYVLEMGENRFEDTGDALLGNKEIEELYLGGATVSDE